MNKIQCSCIGNLGMFGNQIFQYITAKTYAELTNSILEIPMNWIGRQIFTKVDKENWIKTGLPILGEKNFDFELGVTNVDLYGFFQDPKFYKYISISKCKEWLEINPIWLEKFSKENDYVICHLRRGDMEQYHWSYPIITEDAFINAIYEHNYYSQNVLWSSESNPRYDYDCAIRGFDFLPDFMFLYNSDVMFRSPSTFSFWAGLLGNCKMYSPEIDFPDYGSRVGYISDIKFIEGLGPNKEGVFKS